MLTPKRSQLLSLALGATAALGFASNAQAQFSRSAQEAPPQQPPQASANADGVDAGASANTNAGASGEAASNQGQQGQGQQGQGQQSQGQAGATRDRGGFWSDPAFQLNRLRQQVSNLPGGQPGRGDRGRRGGGRTTTPSASANDGLAPMLNLLERSEFLQEEIQLKPEQKEKLSEIEEQGRQQQREMFQQMRANRGNANNNAPGGRGRPDQAMFQQMRQAADAARQQNEQAAARVLTKDQVKRLGQIRLQIIGPLAVAEPAVAQALMLNDDQYQQVQQVVNSMGERRRQRMQEMRDRFTAGGGPGGFQGAPGAQGAAAGVAAGQQQGVAAGRAGTTTQTPGQARGQTDAANRGGQGEQGAEGRQARRGFDPNSPEAQAMQDRMREGMEEEEQIRKEAEAAIAKVLAPAQRTRFNRMLGKIIDLNQLAESVNTRGNRFGGDRGGRGGQGGGGGAPSN